MTHASAEIDWMSESPKDEGVGAGERRHGHRQAEKGNSRGAVGGASGPRAGWAPRLPTVCVRSIPGVVKTCILLRS